MTSRSTMPAGRLFIVRHGESGWNRQGLVQGQSPAAPGLTRAGRHDAAVAAGYLAGSGASLVLTSDLRRARETAAPIAGLLGAAVQPEPRLRERALGAAEGRPSGDVAASELGLAGAQVTDPDTCPPGGETLRQLYERVTDLLSGLLASSPDRRIVLVTHGGPVRIIGACLAGLGAGEMPWPAVRNGSVLEAAFADLGGPLAARCRDGAPGALDSPHEI